MLFILKDNEWFARLKLFDGISPVHVINTRFQNGEISVHLSENVAQKDVILLKRFSSNIHEDIFELLQCVDTLNRMRTKTITLLLPYYPYARQDHGADNESQGALLLAKMLANLGVTKIITIDMHAPEQLRKFPVKIVNLTTEHFWGNYLRALGHDSAKIQIIAADKSAAPRAQQIATALHCSWGYANKQRDDQGAVNITEIFGLSPEKQIFLVDDLIDTGRTIIAATQALRKKTTQPITACITHCGQSPTLLSALASHGLTELITTDTIKNLSSNQASELSLTVLKTDSMLQDFL